MNLKNLKVLNMKQPLGIDVTPYFSWQLESNENNTVQTGYHLTVKDEDGNIYMDSGIVSTKENTYIPYSGISLKSRTIYHWKITVTDNHQNCASAESTFETALSHFEDWTAKWIFSPLKHKKSKPGFGKQDPPAMFRQTFSLKKCPERARLYMTCHGIYEVFVNGQAPDERCFAPEHTVYEKYLCYQTYDVTRICHRGNNVLAIYVGDGWYHCTQSLPNMKKHDHRLAVLFQLELTYEDGTHETINSDTTAKVSNGPIISSDLYAGEKYDANKELPNWETETFDDSSWLHCKAGSYGYSNLKAQLGEPVIPVKELPVKEILSSPNGDTILDFGQNFAGRVRMHVKAPKGTIITLEHCEVLDRNGNYFNNITSAGGVGKGCDQKDVYISDGLEKDYEPHFTYHGFRYVRVKGIKPSKEDFTGIVLSSQKENLGTFLTSDHRLNRLYENIRWSQTSNMLSIPTDCPQREKAGWTGDMLVYAKTAMLNEDCTTFFTRWLYNMSCDQDQYGIIPFVVPLNGNYPMMGKLINLMYGLKGHATSSGWGDAAVAVPYSMYQITGNKDVLRQQYHCMHQWVDYILRQAENNHPKNSKLSEETEKYLWDTGYHYGEWLIPSQNKNGLDLKQLKNIMAVSSCYTTPIFGWYSVSTFATIAEILKNSCENNTNYSADAEKYRKIADKMKKAIQDGIIVSDGSMPSDLMGAYVLPIYFDLVPKKHKKIFADNLVRKIEENNYCMDTGFLTTPYLLDALCIIDRRDLAYKLLWQNKVPSWLSEVDQGGTTIWENTFGYDDQGNPGNLSFNHYAFGAVADWMFRSLGGMVPEEPGFCKIVFAPHPDGKLTFCERTYNTPQGTAVSKWKISQNEEYKKFFLHVEIPCNTTARIILPDGKELDCGSGTYDFESKIA